MEHGWLAAISRVYTEKQTQNTLPTQRQRPNKLEVTSRKNKDADNRIPKTHQKTISNEVNQNAQHISEKNVETPYANSGKVLDTPVEVLHISGQIKKHGERNKCQPGTPLFRTRHKNLYSEIISEKICDRTDVITVIDI